ncbi:MAG: RsiV family protein [Candidatus Paceibacterota bacterium]|jgi:hypothetical protein
MSKKKEKWKGAGKMRFGSLFFFSIIAAAAVFLAASNSPEKIAKPTDILPAKTDSKANNGAVLPDVALWGETKTNTVKETAIPSADGHSNLVEVEGTYPINTPFAAKAEEHVKDFMRSFMNDYPEVNNITQSYEVSAEASVDVFYGKKLASYLYNDWRNDGGAHGNTVFSSETFDMKGKTYDLSDLFLEKTDYLGILSRLATAHFINDPQVNFDPKDVMFGSGLDPKSDNFGAFVVSGRSLIFQFQNYQIGPYSEGAQRFEISTDNPEIKNIIRSELFGL